MVYFERCEIIRPKPPCPEVNDWATLVLNHRPTQITHHRCFYPEEWIESAESNISQFQKSHSVAMGTENTGIIRVILPLTVRALESVNVHLQKLYTFFFLAWFPSSIAFIFSMNVFTFLKLDSLSNCHPSIWAIGHNYCKRETQIIIQHEFHIFSMA